MVRIAPDLVLPDGDVTVRFVPLAPSRAQKRSHEVCGVELREAALVAVADRAGSVATVNEEGVRS